jgi:hypothetical protein
VRRHQQVAPHRPDAPPSGGGQRQEHAAAVVRIATTLDQRALDERGGQPGDHRRADQQAPGDIGLGGWPLGVDDAQHVVLLVGERLPPRPPARVGQQVTEHRTDGRDQARLQAREVLGARIHGACSRRDRHRGLIVTRLAPDDAVLGVKT